MMDATTLWYFADPMCSWCWGFSPVMQRLRDVYATRLKIALMLGGLRPGTTDMITSALRDEILHHWHDVHKLTGQTFTFDNALPDGFVYNTEPPCRAVIAFGDLNPQHIFHYFATIQSAFYVDQLDVTQGHILARLANQHDVSQQEFLRHFHSDAVQNKTLLHFQGTQQAGIRGFPSLVLQQGERHEFISHGYQSYDSLTEKIDNWLAR